MIDKKYAFLTFFWGKGKVMKFTKYSFLGVLVVLSALLYSSVPLPGDVDVDNIAVKLGREIEKRNAKLNKWLIEGVEGVKESDTAKKDNAAEKMAKRFAKDATLISGEDAYHGRENIKEFWRGVMDAQATGVTFELVDATMWDDHKWDFSEIDKKIVEFTHSASEYSRFTISYNPNQTGGEFTTSWRHRQSCPWE